MPSSRAHVRTDAPTRYGKQLASHFGRRIASTWDGSTGTLPFDFGTCTLTAADDALVLRAEATTAEDLARVEEVTGSHLERFGQRHELAVTWHPDLPGE